MVVHGLVTTRASDEWSEPREGRSSRVNSHDIPLLAGYGARTQAYSYF